MNIYLLDAHSKGRNTALIVDEAQNLDVEVLEQLRLLTNLETDTNKLLQIVLIGQPELQHILSDPKLSQINQRVTTRYHLGPLHSADIPSYIQHRINIAGGNNRNVLFSKQAIQYVAKISKGIPRVINILCDHALLGAYANNRYHVNLKIMKMTARELATINNHRRYPTKNIVMAFFLLLATIGIPISLYFFDFGDNIDLFKHNVSLLTETIQPNSEEHNSVPPQAENKPPDLASPQTSARTRDECRSSVQPTGIKAMSYILDALKKSDQERQQGVFSKPALHTWISNHSNKIVKLPAAPCYLADFWWNYSFSFLPWDLLFPLPATSCREQIN